MDRRPSFKKRPNSNFSKGGNKRGKLNEQSSESSQSSETVYRILCPSRKIGSVIGKGGGIIKVLREETQAKITVADSVPGTDERVVMVYSPSTMLPMTNNNNDMELHCAAQDALLRVHDRIIEEDLADGNDTTVIARLLVPNNTVGCLLGKKGDVIQRLRSETGASIRVMPTDQLPACAMSTDELVQISAKPDVAKGALYQVSTLLHENPRKDKPPSRSQISGGQGLHRPGPTFENTPPMNLMHHERGPNARGAPSAPWMGGFGNEPSRFGPNGFGGDIGAALVDETPTEFSMKLLCSAAKIGGVIGKGGSNVRQLQQDTGTNIHVDEASAESDERVIRVSSLEALTIPRSQTIDAVRFLQDKTSDQNEKGLITTRLLIPSSKVGCIIGQGGQVINEMRRRTKADIRVFSKEDKPKCAGEDEELVQVSGSYSVAKDALTEIASRYRARCLRDMQPGTEPAPAPGHMSRGNLASERPSPSGVIRGGRPAAYDPFQGVGRHFEPRGYPGPPPREYEPHGYHAPPPREFEPHGYPVPPRASGYPGAVDMKMPNSGRGSGMGPGVHNTSEVTETTVQDPYAVGAKSAAEMHGSQHLNASHSADVYQGYAGLGGQNRPPQVSYLDNYGTQQGPFPEMNSSHTSYNNTTTTTTSTHPPYPLQQGHYPESAYQFGH